MPYEDRLDLDSIDPSSLSRADCAALLAKVKALEGQLLARLLLGDDRASSGGEANGSGGDRLLTITQAAELLSVSRSWLYHNAAHLGLARKLGDGTLRFGYLACQKFIKNPAASRSPKARLRSVKPD